jgi:uncharacterized protein (DUF3084 family)
MAAIEFPAQGQFVETRVRLEQLLRASQSLDDRARQLGLDEERLAEWRRQLDREAEATAARAIELQELEDRLEQRQEEIWLRWSELTGEAARLDSEAERVARAAADLALREERFQRRWRWLVDCFSSLRFRRRSRAQLCDALFVPTQEGYRLLDQSGLALAPGAVLTGLVHEHRRFVVTKIAPLSFESRVCAYLQETSTEEGDST